MPRILIIVFLLLNTSVLRAQDSLSILKERLKDAKKSEQIAILSSLSQLYISDSLDRAIECAEEALKLARFRKIDPKTEVMLFQILGEAYYYKMEYKEALLFYEKELKAIDKQQITKKAMDSYFNIALISQRLNKNKKADEYYSKSLNIAIRLDAYDEMLSNYLGLTEVNSDMEKYDKALMYFQSYIDLRDKKLRSDVSRKIKILNGKYKTVAEEKQKKDQLLKKTKASLVEAVKKENKLVEDTLKKATEIKTITQDNLQKIEEIKKQENVIKIRDRLLNLFIVFMAVVLVFMVVVFYLYRLKKKANGLLTKSNIKITNQKDKISEQNKEIKDSILYALRIQKALLPPKALIQKQLKDYFILYKPRDIVSGDYYWISQVEEKTIVAAADCTGHGVPGAFMSMLGVSYLTEIVEKERITDPDLILNRMREQVVNSLQQEKGQSADGMDMAILCIDRKENTLKFAGANNPLYLIRSAENNSPLNHTVSFKKEENNGIAKEYIMKIAADKYTFIQLKGDKMPVGIHDNMHQFTQHQISLCKGDAIYIFSDGYVDQFGGPNQKKLKFHAFRDLLINNQDKTMVEQKKSLYDYLKKWQGDLEQVDDVLVLGIKY